MIQMKRILFLTAFPPSNKTAGQNYTSQLLYDISRENQIDLLYWNYPDHKTIIPPTVKIIDNIILTKSKKILNAICSFLFFPLFSVRFNWNTCRKVRSIAHNYDIIYFDFSQVFLYSLFIKHPCKVLMCHDVISQKYSRKKNAFLFLWHVKLTERLLLHSANIRLCFSDKDTDYIKKEFSLKSQKVSFYISDQVKIASLIEKEHENYFVLFGAWNRPENYEGLIWLCENVLPHCDIKCVVVGGGMNEDVRLRIISDKIDYVGFVDNPYPIIARSACLLAPIFQGAGVKVKVIESLALGLPVIGTDIAFEGIDNILYSDKKNALNQANNQEEFIEQIKGFNNPTQKEREEIRESFIKNYQSNNFRSILNQIKTNGK